MGLVDDDEVVSTPVKIGQFVSVHLASFATKVGMRKHMVAEAVFREGAEDVTRTVDRPVAAEFFRAEDENLLVTKLEVFDDGEGGVSFAQADTVCEDAAVVAFDLVDGGTCPIALEGVERLPDLSIWKSDTPKVIVDFKAFVDVAAEEFEEGLVVNKLRRLVAVNLEQVIEDCLFHVGDARGIVPEFVEPLVEVGAVAIAVHDEVEFDVVIGGSETEATGSEIGAADDRRRDLAAPDVGHLAVQETGAGDGAHLDLVANPRGAGLGDVALA